jgi:hypothetical protein
MAAIIYVYLFDPTGLVAGNRIMGEKHALSPPAWKDYHFVIPKLAPYFRESLQIKELNTGRLLVEGVDWLATHRFHDASRAIAKPIYGSITFYDKTFTGVIELSYQTLGGDWVIDGDLITQLLTQVSVNPRITTWESVVDLPYQFPVIDHQWNLNDLVGMSEVKSALEGISQVLIDTKDVRPVVQSHLLNLNNPHAVSKDQVGLGVVENFPIATRSEALDGVHDESYMTPRRVRQSIENTAYSYTDLHSTNSNNPHQVNKEQIGLGAVQNYSIATLIEAEEGESHTKYMTPLRVKDAITSQATNPLNNHKGDLSNPHQVTKTQIGLGSVQDFSVATVSEAETGIRDDRYMTPLLVKDAIVRFAYSYTDIAVEEQGKLYFFTKGEVTDLINTSIAAAFREYFTLTNHVAKPLAHEEVLSQLGLANIALVAPFTLGAVNTAAQSSIDSLLLEYTLFTNHKELPLAHVETLSQLGLTNVAPIAPLTLGATNVIIQGTIEPLLFEYTLFTNHTAKPLAHEEVLSQLGLANIALVAPLALTVTSLINDFITTL